MVYSQVFGLYERPSSGQRGRICLYPLGCNKALKGGKPPPESRHRLDQCKAFDQLTPRCVMLTDGAPVYPKICKDYKVKHLSCNHSKGIFNIRRRLGGKTIDIHTGSIDGLWRLMKESVPHALSSKKTAATMRCVRQWQWRWNCGNSNLAFKLGTQLNQR